MEPEKYKHGVYAIELVGITKTYMFLGIYNNVDQAIESSLQRVIQEYPDHHNQVIQRKGTWGINVLHIPTKDAITVLTANNAPGVDSNQIKSPYFT